MLAALALAPAAAAHGIGSSARLETTVDAIVPAVAGLGVEATDEAGRLRLVNRTGMPVTVVGPAGGPLLSVPAGATAAWHDPRADPPATPTGGERRRILDWRIPLRAGDRAASVRGHVTYVPARRSLLKLGAAIGGAALLAALAASAFWTRRG